MPKIKSKHPNPLAYAMLMKNKKSIEGLSPSWVATLRNRTPKTQHCKAMAALGYELVQTGALTFEYQLKKVEENAGL